MPERQMSEGLLEVLSQRADLALFRSSLLVSGQSGRPAPQIQIIILSLSLSIYIYIYLYMWLELYLFCIYTETQPD